MAHIEYDGALQLAAGYDNTAGYDVITTLTDSDSVSYTLPNPLRGSTLGVLRPTLARRAVLKSNRAITWTFKGMSIKGWYKLYDDYFTVNDSAVTVRSVDLDGSFEDFNANIVIPMNWEAFLVTENGVGIYKPPNGGSQKANFLDGIWVTFNIVGTAS